MTTIRIIKTEDDYKASLAEVARLAAIDPLPGSRDGDRLELLGLLIEDYEGKISQIAMPSPVEAIQFRMEQLGLRQKDLVPYLGSRSKVSEILSGKRTLTLAMVRSLHNGLGIPANVLVQDQDQANLAEEGVEWARFPLTEMVRRGWITSSGRDFRDRAEELVKAFFSPIGGLQPATALLRRTRSVRSSRSMDSHALAAWIGRVLIRAQNANLPVTFDRSEFTPKTLNELVRLSWSEQGPLLAMEFLGSRGVALVIEPHLPQTHLDGAALLTEEGAPVIALTVRHDRIDNFWFSLMHEIAHLLLHLSGTGEGPKQFLDDLDSSSSDAAEQEADEFAGEILVPSEAWRASPASKLRTPEAAVSLAAKLGVHPAIVAGKIRHESRGYGILGKLVGQGEVRKHFPACQWR